MSDNQENQRETISKLVVGTFSNPLGEKLMEHLESTFIDRPIYVDGLTLDQVSYRQGQADLIKQLKKELTNG